MTTLEEVFLKVESGFGGGENDIQAETELKRKLTSELQSKNEEENDYSIAKEQRTGAINIFFLHFWALFLKRILLSIRNYKLFLVDILIPLVLIVAGFGIAKIKYFKDSDQRILEPSLFPLQQRILYNTNNLDGASDITSASLIGNLYPTSDFNPTGVAVTAGGTDRETLENFDDDIYNAAQIEPFEPHRYMSYYFNLLDNGNKKFRVVSYFNTTSQDATVAGPHFIYQAIFRQAVDR
jgi:hypothetical protein